jgi:hypothetical protein
VFRFLFAALCLTLVSLPLPARAQPVTSEDPIYHGVLDVLASPGSFDPSTGKAALRLRRWRFLIEPGSNGVFPDQETTEVLIADNSFALPPGTLRRSRSGKVFSYKAKKDDPSPVRAIKLRYRGYFYNVTVKVQDVDLTQLVNNDGICLPVALRVGDDDAFNGGIFTRPGFNSTQLRISRSCTSEWPWQSQ